MLHRRYRRAVDSYCFRRLRSREEAEDASQLVFLNAYRSLARGIEPISERAWLFGIAQHVVAYRRRTISRRQRIEIPIDGDSLASIPGPASNDGPDLDTITAGLAAMPELERNALLLREWQGLSYREVATELGVSEPSVDALLRRGRRHLGERLRRPEFMRGGSQLGSWLPMSSLKWLLRSATLAKGAAIAPSVALLLLAPTHPAAPKISGVPTVPVPAAETRASEGSAAPPAVAGRAALRVPGPAAAHGLVSPDKARRAPHAVETASSAVAVEPLATVAEAEIYALHSDAGTGGDGGPARLKRGADASLAAAALASSSAADAGERTPADEPAAEPATAAASASPPVAVPAAAGIPADPPEDPRAPRKADPGRSHQ